MKQPVPQMQDRGRLSGKTRRDLLAVPPAAEAVQASGGAEVSFERIDTHNHIHRSGPLPLAAGEREGWRRLSICVRRDRRSLSAVPVMVAGTVRLHRESTGRWAWSKTFGARDLERPDFA